MKTLASVRQLANSLGYVITRNQTDVHGRRWKYRRSPGATMNGGSTCYFDSLDALEANLTDAAKIRAWQQEPLATGV
jgi:hypothetical protein